MSDTPNIPDDVLRRCVAAFSKASDLVAVSHTGIRAALAEYERAKAEPPPKAKTRGEVVAEQFVRAQSKLIKSGVNEDWRINCSADMLEHHLAKLIDHERADAAREEREKAR